MELKDFAINLARKSGKIMLDNFNKDIQPEWKSDNSPVTQIDKNINELVIKEIKKHLPDHNVLGEEASLDNNSEYTWVCDPIDGTSVFSHKIPISTFSLALVQNGEPILGVIYDPFINRLYFANSSEGAFLNDKPIHVSPSDTLNRNFIDIENASKSAFNLWGLHEQLYNLGAKVSNLHSTAYAGSLVACGEFIGVILPHNTCHDAAALKIIVEQAGGKVTDLFGNEQNYDCDIKGAIISNGKIHEKLISEVNKILR